MQVSVEKISKIERRITITVPEGQIEEAYNKKIDNFAKNANVKGFRPGKVPMSYIKQRFGDDARKEAIGEVIQNTLYKAIADEKLIPVSTPKVEPKIMEPNKPLEFVASFEVLPEVDQVNFATDQLEKLVVEITPTDIDHVINHLRQQHTKWQKVDRPAQNDDYMIVTYTPTIDGQAELAEKKENTPIHLGSKKMLPGFEEGLIGAKAGDEVKLALTYPDDFADKEKAGKAVAFDIQVHTIHSADLPALDEEFIQKLGIESGKEDELRQQIQQTLEQEKDRLLKEKLKEQVFTKLIEQNPIEVPPILVTQEAKVIHDEIYAKDQHHQHDEKEMDVFEGIAKKRVALGILIAAYAKIANIQPDTAKVVKRMQEIAASYEKPQEVMEWLSNKERRNGIESQVLEDQVLEKLMDGITLTEKTMTYAALRGIEL
ncbi:MAG: trigger factor [Gammaproteobacteria bacterium]|nr:trigger factor [Gammaproteobacteria bacterium]